MESRQKFDPPLFLGGFFKDSDDETQPEGNGDEEQESECRTHEFPGMVRLCDRSSLTALLQDIRIRELSFLAKNANFVWPGASHLAAFLLPRFPTLVGKRILELGSATGCLSIFLRKKGMMPLNDQAFWSEHERCTVS